MRPPCSAELRVQAWVRDRPDPSPALHRFQPVTQGPRDYDWVKPHGGMWTSTWDPDFGSGWIDWCVGESFGSPPFDVWLLTPDPAARLYIVDSLASLTALVEQFPGRNHLPGSPREYPNWTAVAEVYDGVSLTDEGQWATRLSHPVNLYGWDCECTLWFRWMFTDVGHYGPWSPPTTPCDRGEDCYRCNGSGTHAMSRYDRENADA